MTHMFRYFDLVIAGQYRELLASNSTIGFANKWNFLKGSGRIWIISGLFLLGLWIGRTKLHENIDRIPIVRLMANSGIGFRIAVLLVSNCVQPMLV
jgi:uncharacterized protein